MNRELEQAQRDHQREMEYMLEEDQYQRQVMEEDLARELEKIEVEKIRRQKLINLKAVLEIEDIWRGLPAELASIEADITLQRTTAMVDFHAEMSDMEEQYYKERAEAAADFGLEMQRSEQDHQKAMRRMREDSEVRQKEAIRSRDALALAEERRDYDRERGRADEDFAIEMARRNEDFAKQMVQMEANFREQAAARQAAYDQQVAELAAALAEQTEELEENYQEQADQREEQRVQDLRAEEDSYKEQEKQMKDSHTEQQKQMDRGLDRQEFLQDRSLKDQEGQMQRSFDRQRRELGFWTNDEEREFSNMFGTILSDTRRWARDNAAAYRSGLPGIPVVGQGQQAGGYVDQGIYPMGEKGYEFVMSHPTTRTAEQMLGGTLTQQGILAAMAGRGGGLTIGSIQISVEAPGGDPDEIAQVVRTTTLKVMDGVLAKVK
jgi:hypothetical protein